VAAGITAIIGLNLKGIIIVDVTGSAGRCQVYAGESEPRYRVVEGG
jgi:hypothetical protein